MMGLMGARVLFTACLLSFWLRWARGEGVGEIYDDDDLARERAINLW